MSNVNFAKYSSIAQSFEKNREFALASTYWELACKYSLNEDNRNWCDARALLCVHLGLLRNNNSLPLYLCD